MSNKDRCLDKEVRVLLLFSFFGGDSVDYGCLIDTVDLGKYDRSELKEILIRFANAL